MLDASTLQKRKRFHSHFGCTLFSTYKLKTNKSSNPL